MYRRGRRGDVNPRQQDVRRLSAQFEHDPARTCRGLFDDLLADPKRTGEADPVDQNVSSQTLTDVGAAEDHIQHPGRQDLLRKCAEHQRGQRR
jgi:hypothetical protein